MGLWGDGARDRASGSVGIYRCFLACVSSGVALSLNHVLVPLPCVSQKLDNLRLAVEWGWGAKWNTLRQVQKVVG